VEIIEEEKKVLAYWEKNKIEEGVRKFRSGGKSFYFLDGPPYVTGDLHPAHIWVKTLKDLFVRYKRYRGFDVIDRAGYDVHGLPIENKVEKGLGISSKKEIETKMGVEKFVMECKDYVQRYIGRMDADYRRYGISLDFKNPYLPHTNSYIETAWGVFKTISEKGFLYQGTKTLIYCPHCETPLSQGSMEVEYKDDDDPSVYVAFKIDAKRSKPKAAIGRGEEIHLLVWTTTPWTLPSNVAIAANPKELYVLVKAGAKRFVLAKRRLEALAAVLNESLVVLAEFYGSEMDGIFYSSPIEDKVAKQRELRKYHKIVFSEPMVSMEEGTGLVHIAPGNGIEDYLFGLANRLPIFSPVNPDSTYNSDAGAYAGVRVPFDANKRVLADLESCGALIESGSIRHSYPHCWRCQNKLIFIATKQWFLNVKRIKKRLVRENEKIAWHPQQVRAWQKEILENSPDWCISRQRYWGIPMPVWECERCGKTSVIGSLSELKERATNAQEIEALSDLHRPYIDRISLVCACGGVQKRVNDVLDVWFDSGMAFRGSLGAEQFGAFLPTALVVEYIEQIRGWFQYMLKVGIMAYSKSPFRHIVVHGIMFGTDGKKMAKSVGNFKPLQELADYASADAFRLWAVSRDPIASRNLNEPEIKENEKAVNILHNVSHLLEEYESVAHYKPRIGKKPAPKGLENVDRWILSKLESLIAESTEALEAYDACRAAQAFKQFAIEDFSRFYLKFAKTRMEDKRHIKKTIDLIDYVLYRLLVLCSPIVPFVAESIYLKRYDRNHSIFFEKWPKANNKFIDKGMEEEVDIAREAITAILNNREKNNAKLRSPILSATVETSNEKAASVLQRLATLVEAYTNAKQLKIVKASQGGISIKPVFARLGPEFKGNATIIAEGLANADASAVREEIERSGRFRLHTQNGTFDIGPEHFVILEKAASPTASPFKYGLVSIDATQTEEIREELLVREVCRRIQVMRKEVGLTKVQGIELIIVADGAALEPVRKNIEEIKRVTRAYKAELSEAPVGNEGGFVQKEWALLGNNYTIAIRKR
jgi:isoleucyl-tRNA synthetase